MTAPLERTIEQDVPAVGTAGNDDDTIIGQAPFAGTVTRVEYVPEAAITGAATNNRTVSLVNKAADGTGTATVASLNFASGVNAAANDERVITLSSTAADKVVAAGDTLQWRSIHIATGITDPGGVVRVTIARS